MERLYQLLPPLQNGLSLEPQKTKNIILQVPTVPNTVTYIRRCHKRSVSLFLILYFLKCTAEMFIFLIQYFEDMATKNFIFQEVP